MYLENLSLTQFKNYRKCDLNFSRHLNCILGPNGSGKTNLLDAIHYLSLTKSAFNPIDQQNIQHHEDFFSIRGVFHHQGKSTKIQCSFKSGGKKVIKKDQTPYKRISEHIGNFPTVMISPYDTGILREGSSVRRKFMDGIISQIDPLYLQSLMKYQRLLLHRNQLLKNFAIKHQFDEPLLMSYDKPMLQIGEGIAKRRRRFLKRFVPLFLGHYRALCDEKEQVDIVYKSDVLDPNFKQRFIDNRNKDLTMQRTEMGIHKDDLMCLLEGYPVRKLGSQGQQKSFVIALKLGQFELIQAEKGFKPILLLDDIFDKLDDQRINKLMDMVSGKIFGQIFITDARSERTARILNKIDTEIHRVLVDNGIASEAGP
jgi:DNA replication and repair protein RecF